MCSWWRVVQYDCSLRSVSTDLVRKTLWCQNGHNAVKSVNAQGLMLQKLVQDTWENKAGATPTSSHSQASGHASQRVRRGQYMRNNSCLQHKCNVLLHVQIPRPAHDGNWIIYLSTAIKATQEQIPANACVGMWCSDVMDTVLVGSRNAWYLQVQVICSNTPCALMNQTPIRTIRITKYEKEHFVK